MSAPLFLPSGNPKARSVTRTCAPRHGRPYYVVRAIVRAITKTLITLGVLAALASPSLITGPF